MKSNGEELLSNVEELTLRTLSIQDEVLLLLRSTNYDNSLNNNPNLTLILLVDLQDNPCGTCIKNLKIVESWGMKNGFLEKGIVRIIISQIKDLPREYLLWEKLHIYDNQDETPKTMVFDKNKCLKDILVGGLSEEYLDRML